ncbi:hypothetical protein PTKIN_Ptkin19aG0105800 [Pterospermum kingtungense]
MGRAPCCDKANVKRGPWSPEEDATLKNYLQTHGTAGLKRCGKSCRLRWLNYLRPDIKHGGFTEEEDNIICTLHSQMGSRWSLIASQLPGRTDNDVKNHWNTKLKKKVLAGNSSFNIAKPTTTTTINNGVIPGDQTNYIATHSQASRPYNVPEVEADYNLDYYSPLPVLSDVGYGFSVSTTDQNLALDSVMLTHNVTTTSQEESSNISDSTSLATESKCMSMPAGNGYDHHVEDTGNMLMDDDDDQFSYEFPYEFVNGLWGQEIKAGGESTVPSCCDGSLADVSHADIKPQGLNQSVANRY